MASAPYNGINKLRRLAGQSAVSAKQRRASMARIGVGQLLGLILIAVQPAWAAPKTMEERKSLVFERLIEEAEKAVQAGRLTTPSADNAYDKLRAAALLRPGDPRVQAGLQAVVASYEDRVDVALEQGSLEEAGVLLQRLAFVAPDHEGLAKYRQQLAEARSARPAQTTAPDQKGRIWLSPSDLRARGQPITIVLQELAQEVQRSNWSVHIYARTDEEGRWIYKTLNDAVPGYRIRGDIRISATPYVQLMDPLT